MRDSTFKSFVRAANVKSGSTVKRSMGGIEAHAKRLDKTALLRRVRELEPLAWSKIGAGINGGGCDIWDAFKRHKDETGAVERGGASLALHMLVGVSREWLEEDGRDPHSEDNDRILTLFREAKAWTESWAGEGSVIHTRFDLDEQGSGNVDVLVVPTRMQRRKTRKKVATKEVLTISTRMAKEELRKSLKAKTSGQAMQTSWNDWCRERLDLRIQRGTSREQTQHKHIHADVLRAEGDRQRAEHRAAMDAVEAQKTEAAARAEAEAKAANDALLRWAKAATGPYHGLLLEDLSEEQCQAYKLHRMALDRYRSALAAERRGKMLPEQNKYLWELRNAEPDPDRHVAASLTEEISAGGIGLDMISRVSELMRRLLQRIVDAIEAHLLNIWSRDDGAHEWDASTARLCLGSAQLVDLEVRVEKEADELRAAEQSYRRLVERGAGFTH
ncbi:plasmid recombination protein [Aliiroseovarius crassostreae]|uniref:plasmid recombination protein n=1 Tax=Aliiroseovarius crassostreae TaxID=154981 RepID=UPI002202A12F|nr:plasmid recombination protein [Aliiroseovarius crassostreae]UWQ01047.1 plasmid recombination protein [Aliiroseovarius crassostreae]